MSSTATSPVAAPATGESAAPRLGFAGVGWIGRNRMEAIHRSGLADVAAIAEPAPEPREAAAAVARGAQALGSFEELLEADLDGVVIATPSALHAEQAIAAFERGLAVFCQKPLARDRAETAAVLAAARSADRLLGVDLAYRQTCAARAIRRLVEGGTLGRVYAIDLDFHNAYGPDKAWFRRRELAGGGCLLDLGTHLVDLMLWLLDPDEIEVRSSHVLLAGAPLPREGDAVEDHAIAELELDGAVVARVACSWWLSAGRDCALELTIHGSEASAALLNVGGSFYDFEAELRRGTTTTTLSTPPDAWSGRAAVAWARRLADDPGFDPAAGELERLAGVLDEIYAVAR